MSDPPYVMVKASARREVATLGDTELRLWFVLGTRINKDGECFPSIEQLSHDTGRSERMVRRAVGTLIERGLVTVRSRNGGRAKANVYAVSPMFTYGRPPLDQETRTPVSPLDQETRTPMSALDQETRTPMSALEETRTPVSALDQETRTPVSALDENPDTGVQKRGTPMSPQVEPYKKNDVRDSLSNDKESPVSTPNGGRKAETPTAKARSPTKEEIGDVLQALDQRRGYPSPQRAAEAKSIKWMLQHGYTLETIMACFDALKREPFWRDKPLLMASVAKEIGEFVKRGQRPREERDGRAGKSGTDTEWPDAARRRGGIGKPLR